MPTASSRLGSFQQQTSVLRHRVAQGDEDLLLAPGPGEVALAARLAGAGIGERVDAVEVVPSGLDRPPLAAAQQIPVVGRVVEPLLDRDVDATDGIDHLDEARELHPRVVMDVDAEQRTERIAQGGDAALGELVRMCGRRTTSAS